MDQMDETLKRKAYLDGMNLKKSGLDNETIYARLEKSGVPHELAEQVVKDISEEVVKTSQKVTKEYGKISIVILIVGVLTAVLSAIFFPNFLIIPSGLIITGLIGIVKANMD